VDAAALAQYLHTRIPSSNRTAEISYDIHPAWWGRGLASTCCAATADEGFAQAGHVRIQGTVVDSNAASARVLAKCGFGYEGTLRSFRMVRGVPRDCWLCARVAGPARG